MLIPTPVPDTGAAALPRGVWRANDEAWALCIAGDWRGHRAVLPAPPPDLRDGRLTVDASGLLAWDAGLASALWQRLAALDPQRVTLDLHTLPPGLRQMLAMALRAPVASASASSPSAAPTAGAWSRMLTTSLRRAAGAGHETLTFVGEVLISFGRLLRGHSRMRRTDLAWQVEQTGPRSLPIVALVSFLVGLIVAYMGAAQLQRFGAQVYIADLVTVGVVREIAALLVGIVLAGRVGAAFAAQIGSMQANEELDALRALGVDTVDYLVLPRVLALLLVGPLLTAFAAMMGMAAGMLVAVGIYGVTPIEYLLNSREALTMPHVLIGLLKGTVYALLVALAGCSQGLRAGRSAQAVGDATTAAVVQSIVWIVVAASALTVMFQRLDL